MDSEQLSDAKRRFLEQVKRYCTNPSSESGEEVLALGRVVDFLRAAGIAATSDGRAVRVGGTPVTVSEAQAASRAKLEALIDELVWSRFKDALLQSISRHLDGAAALRASAFSRVTSSSVKRCPPRLLKT